MTHIICRAMTCLFWEQGACAAEEIEYEPDAGCLTFQDIGDFELEEETPDEEDLDWDEDTRETAEDAEDQDWPDDDWDDDGADL